MILFYQSSKKSQKKIRYNLKHLWLILFICPLFGQEFGNYKISSPYLSPGIQIGINSDKNIFWGFQLSAGIIIRGNAPNESVKTLDFISPAFCYGYRKYFKAKNKEKYYDLQVTIIPDLYDLPIFGFGIGRIISDEHSSFRFKSYTFLLAAASIDYVFNTRKINMSIIPVLPIGKY